MADSVPDKKPTTVDKGGTNAQQDVTTAVPLFSIIVPVWNRAATIRRCFDSIFSQDFQDFEVVAVDDGSTDESLAVMQRFTDPRLRIIRHECNRGMNPTRHTAAENARGRWIMQLDSDDALLPGALSRVAELTRSASADVGLVGMAFQYDVGGTTPKPPFPPGDVGFEQWLAWLDKAERVDFLMCCRREAYNVPGDGRLINQMMLRMASRWKFHVDNHPGAIAYTDATNRMMIDKAVLMSREAKQLSAMMSEEILEEFGPALKQHAPRRYQLTVFGAGRWYFLAGSRLKGALFMLRYLVRRPLSLYGWLYLVLGLLGPWALLGTRRLAKLFHSVTAQQERPRESGP